MASSDQRLPSVSERLLSVDLLRGAAASSVFIFHARLGPALARATGDDFWRLLAYPGTEMAVPLFFALSGFCIHSSMPADSGPGWLRTYAGRRFWRIYPPYLIALAAAIVAFYSDNGFCPPGVAVRTGLGINIFFADEFNGLSPVLWSVAVELWLYALYPLWRIVRFAHGVVVATTGVAIISALSIAVMQLWQLPAAAAWIWFPLSVWIGWIGGALLADARARRIRFSLRAKLLVGALLCAASWAVSFVPNRLAVFLQIPLTIFWGVAVLALLLQCEPWLQTRRGLLRRLVGCGVGLGTISYSLYLWHEPALAGWRGLVHGAPDGWRRGLTGLGMGSTLVVAWLAWRWIEVPFANLGRMIARTRLTPAVAR